MNSQVSALSESHLGYYPNFARLRLELRGLPFRGGAPGMAPDLLAVPSLFGGSVAGGEEILRTPR